MKIRINPTLLGVLLAVTGCPDGGKENPTTTKTTNDDTEGATNTGAVDPTTSTTNTPPPTSTGDVQGTTTESTPETSGSSFIVMNDMMSNNIECDVWAQDCPDGQKCMPWANDGGGSWNATKCSPVQANPGLEGDPCTVEGSAVAGIDSCDVGLLCWYFDENGGGSCIDMCKGSPENASCDDGQFCDISNEGVLILCLNPCDPLVQSCPEGQICFSSTNGQGFICDFDASGEEGQYGDPCAYINVCDYGLFCATPESVPGCDSGDGCCTPYCNLEEPNTCPGADGGQECVPWYTEGSAPPGQENIGACAVPA